MTGESDMKGYLLGKKYIRASVTKAKNPDDLDPPLPPHLGGGRHRCHFDNGALDYLIDRYGVKSMIDVGCGLGCVVEMAKERGLVATGIDGDAYCKPDVLWDFTQGPLPAAFAPTDLIWSMEFLEHIQARYIANYAPVFQAGKVLMVTYAPVGKAGRHHVNCQSEEYWTYVFRSLGFVPDEEGTAGLRAASRMGTISAAGHMREQSGKPFIPDLGLVFLRA